MKQIYSDTFDMLYIDCSLHTSMSIRWEKRAIVQNKNFVHSHSNYCLLQQASTELSTQDIKHNRSEKLPLICDELRVHCEGTYKTLKAVCVCIGPGSFTGTRSSLAFAKGLCCANNIKLITLTSFHIIAHMYSTYRPLITLCDARSNCYTYQLFTQNIKVNNNNTNNTRPIYALDNSEEAPIKLLDINALYSKIQLLLQQYPTLYIAGEPAELVYKQLHEQYTQYYTAHNEHNITNSNAHLLLPHIPWENLYSIHIVSSIAFSKFISNEFSSIDCIPLYGKHYI